MVSQELPCKKTGQRLQTLQIASPKEMSKQAPPEENERRKAVASKLQALSCHLSKYQLKQKYDSI
jgi:hypothetical protein